MISGENVLEKRQLFESHSQVYVYYCQEQVYLYYTTDSDEGEVKILSKELHKTNSNWKFWNVNKMKKLNKKISHPNSRDAESENPSLALFSKSQIQILLEVFSKSQIPMLPLIRKHGG